MTDSGVRPTAKVVGYQDTPLCDWRVDFSAASTMRASDYQRNDGGARSALRFFVSYCARSRKPDVVLKQLTTADGKRM